MKISDQFARLLDFRFVRFLMVGVLNTIFGYGFFALLLYVGLHYALAAFLSTVVGVLFNFKTTGRFVFGSKGNREILYFVGVYVIVFAVNLAGLRAFALFDVSPYIGGAVLVLPMAVLAFYLNKKIVFKK